MSLVRFQMLSLEFFIDIKSFRSHYGPGVDSTSNRNEYQEYFLGVKTGRCVRLTSLPTSWAIVTYFGNLNSLEPSGNLGPAILNLLTPNVDYSGRTAPLTSKCCILYIYSTNTGTENFKHGINSPFFPLKNAVCLKNLTYLVSVLFTFYIQDVLK